MKVFEAYLFRSLLKSFLPVIFIMALIVGGRLLIELSAKTAHGSYPVDLIAVLWALGLADTMIYLLPFCALLTVVIALGNLYQNNEIYAAYTICISKSEIYRVLLRFVLPLSVVLFYLVLETAPTIHKRIDQIKQEASERTDLSIVQDGRLSRIAHGVLFVADTQDEQLKGVFVAIEDRQRMTITTAARGRQSKDDTGTMLLYLEDGDFYQSRATTRSGISFYTVDYNSHRIQLPAPVIQASNYKPKHFDFLTLWHTNHLAAKAELQMRLSIPLVLLVLLPFVEWLSRSSPQRYKQQAKLALGIVVFLIYSNLTTLMGNLIENGQLPAAIGVWPLHLAVFTTAVAVAMRRDRD